MRDKSAGRTQGTGSPQGYDAERALGKENSEKTRLREWEVDEETVGVVSRNRRDGNSVESGGSNDSIRCRDVLAPCCAPLPMTGLLTTVALACEVTAALIEFFNAESSCYVGLGAATASVVSGAIQIREGCMNPIWSNRVLRTGEETPLFSDANRGRMSRSGCLRLIDLSALTSFIAAGTNILFCLEPYLFGQKTSVLSQPVLIYFAMLFQLVNLWILFLIRQHMVRLP